MTKATTPTLSMQNYFSTTTSAPVSSSDTVIYLTQLPTASEGYLELDEGLSTKEIVYYTSKGANFITCPDATAGSGRGVGGTTPAAHASGAVVKQKINAEYWTELQNGNAAAVGRPIQIVYQGFGAVATGTTAIPYDDTIPQNTEGDQYMTLAITPKASTNILVVQVAAWLSASIVENVSMALFQDSTASAIGAVQHTIAGSQFSTTLPLITSVVAGTTSSTTFKVRAGGNLGATITFNGTSGGRKFSTLAKSYMMITEYRAV